MNFEWDEEKNKSNIRRHGFDFADAWEIFEAPMRTALDLREDYGEDRWNGIGFLGIELSLSFSLIEAQGADFQQRVNAALKIYAEAHQE